MQFAKDSFSMALRERLAGLNPSRTVMLSGAERPALVVLENEMPNADEPLADCFYLTWGTVKPVGTGSLRGTLCAMDCNISYFTRGTVPSGVDRGRALGEMDRELFMICQPTMTGKRDFSQSPNVELGTGVFWTLPAIEDGKSGLAGEEQDRARVGHEAKLTVFFYPEVEGL